MGTVNRWMYGRVLIVLSGLVILTLFTLACGDEDTPTATRTGAPSATATATATSAPTNTPTTAAAKVPVASRLIVSGAFDTPITITYQGFQSTGGILRPMYDFMVGRDIKTSEEIPSHLATSWSVAANGKDWTFELRQKAPFYQDGKPSKYTFSSKDVRHTWEIMAALKGAKSIVASDWTALEDKAEDIELPSDHTSIWHLKSVNLDLPFYLSEEWSFGVTSLDYWNDVGGAAGYEDKPIGTGPFSLSERVAGQRYVYKRNEGHYRKTPEFPELEFLWTTEAATRVAQLIAGEAHIVGIPRTLKGQVTSKGMKIAKSTLPSVHMWIRVPWYKPTSVDGKPRPHYNENEPIRNIKVRQALNEAIDRAAINNTFYQGEAAPEPNTHFPPWRDDFKNEWAPVPGIGGKTGKDGGWPYPYNPDHAKQLLTEAGYPNGFDLNFMFANDSPVAPELPDVAEAIGAMWQKVGIKVNLQVKQNAEIRALQIAGDWSGSVNIAPYSLDPVSIAMSFLYYKNARSFVDYDFIVDWKTAYDQITNLEERRKKAQELGDWWHNNYISVPMLWIFAEAAYNPAVVEGYGVNMLHFGPVRYHEYSKPVFK